MNFSFQKIKITDELKCVFIAVLVIIGTFPENDWSFSIGIDSPLAWVFNYLFENGLNMGKQIVFPHGPLAFFMYPLTDNILFSTLVTSIIKTLLVFNIYWLFSEARDQMKWLVVFIFAYLISIIAVFNYLILANILLLYCNSFLSNKNIYKQLALLLTGFAFFVKAYVAILSGILFFSYIIYSYYTTKSIKRLLYDCILLLGIIIMFWIFMYGTLNGLVQYIWGIYHLAQDNSTAVAYYPYNNWVVLTLFFLSIITIFLINRTKKSLFFGILIGFSLFAAWKHGMAREDIYHVKGFLIYTFICLSVFIVFYKKNIFANLILSVIAIFLFSFNMKNSLNYYSAKYELFNVNNFVEFISEFPKLKQRAADRTQSNISINKLPQNILDSISNSTVDVYPWDYSIIAANNLKWQPRVIIQSYASYTSWLDNKNATHFRSTIAPDYLIWELDKVAEGINGGRFNSIDDRYLLNDEPETMVQIISNYDVSFSQNKFQLYKKRTEPVPLIKKDIEIVESNWNEWINVPNSADGLLRAKLKFNKSIIQAIKSFFYKDEQFWVYFELNNGSIHKYKIIPKNAVEGLWVNPYIFNSGVAYTVEKIMFKCSNQDILTKKLVVNWEQIMFDNDPARVEEFFRIEKRLSDSIIYHSINDFESSSANHWNELSNDRLSEISFNGKKSHLLRTNSFSSTFSFPLDSIPFQDLKITVDCWVKSPEYKSANDISLIFSIDDENGNIIWKGQSIGGQLLDKKRWNNIFNFVEYKHNKANCTLKAYVWNVNNNEILIDNFRILILRNSPEYLDR